MALSRLVFFCIFSISCLFAAIPADQGGQVLYMLHRGRAKEAFQLYLEWAKETNTHDFAFLQQAGIRLLEEGISSGDPETQLLCMFGAGVASSMELLPILEKGIMSSDLKTQVIALNYLGRLQDDGADLLLIKALSSPFLLTRLEACLQLAQKNHPSALGHIHALLVKVPEMIRPLFAQIAIYLEGSESQGMMRQLLLDPDINVRLEAIYHVGKAERDDFLPQVRNLVHEAHPAQQECCLFALGALQDVGSQKRMQDLFYSRHSNIRLTAASVLFKLGEREKLKYIESEASEGNLFAISTLGTLGEGHGVLKKLLSHPDRDIRLNAILALLQAEKETPIEGLEEILIQNEHNWGFARLSSAGKALHAWKAIPSAAQQEDTYPGLLQQTLTLREKILAHCIELPEEDFLKIASQVIAKNQTELIPILMELLENRPSPKVIALLKDARQKAGAPLIRHYCTLALYRLQEEGPYEKHLIDWIHQASHEELIRFKEEDLPTSLNRSFQLTPQETSRLLVETFETLAASHNPAGVDALLYALAYGNPKNRYALAGLLIRTTE